MFTREAKAIYKEKTDSFCPNCNSSEAVACIYEHALCLNGRSGDSAPLLPYKRSYGLECEACGEVTKVNKSELKHIQFKGRYPWWRYLFIPGCVFCFFCFLWWDKYQESEAAKMALYPKVGQHFHYYDKGEGLYAIFRIVNILGDHIAIQVFTEGVKRRKHISSIERKACISQDQKNDWNEDIILTIEDFKNEVKSQSVKPIATFRCDGN